MNSFAQDIRYALRQLRKSPGFTITVVVTLALGIGANTAIFTLVHGILLRTLPFGDPAQLYRIGDNDDCCVDGGFPGDASETGDFTIFSADLYRYLRANTPEFQQLAAMQAGQWRWAFRHGNMLPKSMRGEFVSGNYFNTFGIPAFSGRMFSDADDTPSAPPAVVISYQMWQTEFAGDAAVVGSTVFIQAHPYTVIGIAPPGFFGDRVTDSPPDFWLPLETEAYVRGDSSILHHGDSHWLYLVGRVRPGIAVAALQSKITATLRQWLWTRSELITHGGGPSIAKMHVVMTPGGGGIQSLQQENEKSLKMLMILSSVVLLIACANIASLMMARATTRRSEIAVRMSLGAGRRRVIRQILTESILLSILGGLAGLAVAYAGSRTILTLAFPDAPNLPIHAEPSLAILGFAFLISLGTGVVFGAGPAWLSSHAQPAEVLRGVNRSTRDRSSLPQKALVVLQAALSIVLLAGAILMTRTLNNLEHQNFGLVTSNRYVLHFDPAGAGYTGDRLTGLYRQLQDRFTSLPGVSTYSLSMYSPLEGDNWGECVIQQGHAEPKPGDHCGSTWERVSPSFLASIGVPIVRGRDLSEQDASSSPQVAVVSETFAKKFFPNQNPIGQHFGIDYAKYSGAWQIVGVFRDFKINNPRDEVRAIFLRPLAQRFAGFQEPSMVGTETQSMFMQAMILGFNRPQADADGLIRKTLASVDPNLSVIDLRTFDSQVAGNFTSERLVARLTTLFGALATILASVGIYGVMSYFVARRTGEIGIRMALGSSRSGVVAMIMRDVMWQILIGLALGIPAAFYAEYAMKSLLYGIGNYDAWALVGAPLMLTVFATAAGFIPARRAASIEPMEALRTE
jgi:predicted permease